MLEAIAVAGVGLLGVGVGAFLNGAVQQWTAEKEKKSQERAALRLLADDLLHARSTLTSARNNDEWWPRTWAFHPAAWDEYRELLASRLDSNAWATIARAFFRLRGLVQIVEVHYEMADPPPGQVPVLEYLPQQDGPRIEGVIDAIEDANYIIGALLATERS